MTANNKTTSSTARTARTLRYGPFTIAVSYGMAYPLTDCCSASATGTEYGIACRGCYYPIDWVYSTAAFVSDPADLNNLLETLRDTQPAAVRTKMRTAAAAAAITRISAATGH